MNAFETASPAVTEERPELAAARAILTALNQILGEGGRENVTSQQVVNELLPGAISLRNWFLSLIEEAIENGELDRAEAIQKALGFQVGDFEKGCNIALAIIA